MGSRETRGDSVKEGKRRVREMKEEMGRIKVRVRVLGC